MKKLSALCALLLMAISTVAAAGDASTEGYNIKVKVSNKSLYEKNVYLAFYFNGKTYSTDTAKINNNGVATFAKKEKKNGRMVPKKLDEGVYIIYFDANKFYDLLIGKDQNLTVEVDTTQNSLSKVLGSSETEDLEVWKNFVEKKNKERNALSQQYKDKKVDSLTAVNKFDAMGKEVKAFQTALLSKHNGDWLSAFIKGTDPVEVPDMKEVPDSIRRRNQYYWKKDHYFDNVNLSDPRFLRTPYFPMMVDGFMKSYLLQHPDTLYAAAEKLIEKSRYNKETFQTMCSKMINYGLSSNQMGMDALWSKIAQKYYLTEPRQATWADSAWVEDLRKEVRKVQYNLVGMEAKDLRMKDKDGKTVVLSDLQQDLKKNHLTLVYFYEPTCGHCRKTTPILHDSIYAKYHKYGFEVFAVYTQTDKKEWVDFMEKDHLQDFVNVWDPDRESYFWEFYDATVTPGVYLVDMTEGRKIIAKKIDMKTLGMILEEILIKEPAKKAATAKK